MTLDGEDRSIVLPLSEKFINLEAMMVCASKF